ncbi:hypothetical protein C8Q72DRAFT_794108 [Fomitopsis betulina]|nr:hypothetical protein C8Q72DRAFT_794108 [Fomitopsis betulina]
MSVTGVRRHPEQWEPQEFIGTTFSGHWYYFGTYSIASEPVSVTKEEFKQLSHEGAFVTEYKRLHYSVFSVSQLINRFEEGSLAAAKYVVHQVGFNRDVDNYLRNHLQWGSSSDGHWHGDM